MVPTKCTIQTQNKLTCLFSFVINPNVRALRLILIALYKSPWKSQHVSDEKQKTNAIYNLEKKTVLYPFSYKFVWKTEESISLQDETTNYFHVFHTKLQYP